MYRCLRIGLKIIACQILKGICLRTFPMPLYMVGGIVATMLIILKLPLYMVGRMPLYMGGEILGNLVKINNATLYGYMGLPL